MSTNVLQKYKGIILAFLSMFLGCMATIFYKPIMQSGVSPVLIGLIESGILTVILLYSRPWRLLKSNRRIFRPIILSSLLQAVGSISFIFGLHFLDPVTFSFLNRNQALFSIVLGYFFLKERHNAVTWTYIITAVIGSIILCYADMNEMNMQGLLFALLFCSSFSLRNFVMRKNKRMPAIINIFYGNLFTFLLVALFAIYRPNEVAVVPDINTIVELLLVAVLAIFGTLYFYQLAFRFEKLSVISPIRLFSPFIITIYFGWQIGYNYSPIKMFGIVIMTISCCTLIYSYKMRNTIKIEQAVAVEG